MGVIIEGSVVPSIKPMAEDIVPALEELPFMESKASARSKTLPLNIALYAGFGVDGTVACTAGPNAALWGVIGNAIGDVIVSKEPLEMPFGLDDQGDC